MATDPYAQLQAQFQNRGYDPLAIAAGLGMGRQKALETEMERQRRQVEAQQRAEELQLRARQLEQSAAAEEARRKLELEKLGIQATQAEKELAGRRELAGMELAGRKELTGMELAGRRDLSQEELAARRQMAQDEAMARLGMTREEIQSRRDLAKEEAQLRRDLATQEAQARRDITGQEIQGRKDLAAQEAGAAMDRLVFQSAQQRYLSREEQDRLDNRARGEIAARFNLQQAQLEAQTAEGQKDREARRQLAENALNDNPTEIIRFIMGPDPLTQQSPTEELMRSRAKSIFELFPNLRARLNIPTEPAEGAAGGVPTVDKDKVEGVLRKWLPR